MLTFPSVSDRKPYQKEEYLLGMLLDGDSYRENQNTRDREVPNGRERKIHADLLMRGKGNTRG